MISEKAKRNKIRQAQKITLLEEIQTLEQKHKDSQEEQILTLLIRKRESLQELLDQETKWVFDNTSKRFYAMGNKSGKLLARVIKPKNAQKYILKIKDKKGDMKHSTKDIIETKIYIKLIKTKI